MPVLLYGIAALGVLAGTMPAYPQGQALPQMGKRNTMISKIIANVVSNEQLYDNLYSNVEVIVSENYQLYNWESYLKKKSPIFHQLYLSSVMRERVIVQGNCFYGHYQREGKTIKGDPAHEESITSYDGERKLYIQGELVNIIHDRGEFCAAIWIRPHNFACLIHGQCEIYSAKLATWKDEISEIIEEIVDNLPCIKICMKRKQPHEQGYHWLCPERNYLPIKEQWFNEKGFLIGETKIYDLREVKDGFWVPFRRISWGYDIEEGKQVLSTRDEYVIEKFDLHPHYPLTFFRDVPFPDKCVIYEVRGGKIVNSYLRSVVSDAEETEKLLYLRPWLLGVLLILSVIFLLLVVIWLRRRLLRRGA
jgi:hypothetical protein